MRSNYAYTVNSIGQRTDLTTTGTEMSTSGYSIAWTYNSRGELTEEDYGDNSPTVDARDRVFAFDAIGNRQETASGILTLPSNQTPALPANYTANSLNEYTLANGVALPNQLRRVKF